MDLGDLGGFVREVRGVGVDTMVCFGWTVFPPFDAGRMWSDFGGVRLDLGSHCYLICFISS